MSASRSRGPALAGRARSARRTRTSGSASSASCARPATAAGRCGCAGGSTRSTRRRARSWPPTRPSDEPDGTLLKCCGNRREAVCPSCARTYRGDAFQLVASGMRGGKGVPETGRRAPAGVPDADGAELRAGALASRRRRQGAALPAAARWRDVPARRLARLRRGPRRGRPAPGRAALRGVLRLRARGAVERARARAVAADGDPAPARARAPAAASRRSELRVRVSYVKVAEFQRRGALHFHCVLRLDGVDEDGELEAPARRATAAQLLIDAALAAVRHVSVLSPAPDDGRMPGLAPRRRARSAGARRSRCARSTRAARPRRRRRARATSPSTRRSPPRRSAG